MIQLFHKNGSNKLVNEFGFEQYLENGWYINETEAKRAAEIEAGEVKKPEEPEVDDKVEKALKETKEALEAVEDLKKSSTKKKK